MKLESEGIVDRLWFLFRMCEDLQEDNFTILSDVFILFFDISKEELATFTTTLRKERLKVMRGALLSRLFNKDEKEVIEKIGLFGNMLLHSYDQYNLPIYIKAYHMVNYIATGDVSFLQTALLSPYCIPGEIPEDKDSYMYV